MVVAGRARRRRRRDHDGRGRGHHRRVAPHQGRRRPLPTEEIVAAGPRGRQAVHQGALRGAAASSQSAAKPTAEFPRFLDYQDDVLAGRHRRWSQDELGQALTIAGKQERETELDRIKDCRQGEAGRPVRGSREGDQRGLPLADQEARPPADPQATRSASTAVASTTSARSRPRSRCCRGCTARRCSSAARPRSSGVTTLNMLRMEQMIDTLNPENRKRYMHNYNFPPYSTGETGRVRLAEAARDRPRRARRAGAAAGAAGPRGVPLRDPPGVRGARLQRLDVDGLGLRLDDVAAAAPVCRCRRRSRASRWA